MSKAIPRTNEFSGTNHSENLTRSPWEMPTLTKLPPLTELTLVTGAGIHGGGGSSGGSVF
ncbi:MAG: hypothetical protein JWM95_3189 [Gemmatimonadetes bacterium]|nr:hypothetical protein [Gemmatimonadota bacterium]